MPNKCKFCLGLMLDDVGFYKFCSKECQYDFYVTHEVNVSNEPYKIDKEIFKQWLENKVKSLDDIFEKSKMGEEAFEQALNEVVDRISTLAQAEFYAKQETRLVYELRDKMLGRKGISPLTKTMRERMITEPNIKVNFNEPLDEKKLKVKKSKKYDMSELLGISQEDLNKAAQAKRSNPQADKELLANWKPTEDKPKVSAEEVANRANSLKERLAAAKLARESNNAVN